MADFCKQCGIETFGSDFGDLKGMCLEGQTADTLCEGCGPTTVDHEGNCVSPDCMSKGKPGHGCKVPEASAIPTVELLVHGRPISVLLEKLEGMPKIEGRDLDDKGRTRFTTPAWPTSITVVEEQQVKGRTILTFFSGFVPVPEAASQWYDKATAAVRVLVEADPEGYAEFRKFAGNATIHAPMNQCPVWQRDRDEEFLTVVAAAAKELVAPGWQVEAAWTVEKLAGREFCVRLVQQEATNEPEAGQG